MTASTAAELAFLSRTLKAPRIRAVAGRLADQARDEGWDHETYLAAVLAEEVSARDSHGGAARVKAARFPAVKTIDDFDFRVQTSVKRDHLAHLAQLDFLAEAVNVVFLGPPGTGKTHLSIALSVQAARRGHRVAFATAHQWVNRLGAAKRAGRLDDELERLGRIALLVVDEVGYIPFDPEAAALFFALVSSRYERRSMIVSSNKTFSAWAEIFGDPVAVAALVDRLVHHAEVIVLKGDSYRLRGKGEEVLRPPPRHRRGRRPGPPGHEDPCRHRDGDDVVARRPDEVLDHRLSRPRERRSLTDSKEDPANRLTTFNGGYHGPYGLRRIRSNRPRRAD